MLPLSIFDNHTPQHFVQESKNIFDNLPFLASLPQLTTPINKLNLYLSTEPEDVTKPIEWWYKKRKTYPCLHQMALNYLMIPGVYLAAIRYSCSLTDFHVGTSVDVEHLFSCGQLILSHTCSQLSVPSMHALLCLGSWSHLGLVMNEDIEAVTKLDDISMQAELNILGDIVQEKKNYIY